MRLWKWWWGIYDKTRREKELTDMANQPSMLVWVFAETQKWLDREGPLISIEDILWLKDGHEWNFKWWLTPEIVNNFNTPWIFEK